MNIMGFADFRRNHSSHICTHQFGGFLHNNFVDCFLIFSPYLSNLLNYIQTRSNYITEFSIEEFLNHRILIIFFFFTKSLVSLNKEIGIVNNTQGQLLSCNVHSVLRCITSWGKK
jgi:hypothetical protein